MKMNFKTEIGAFGVFASWLFDKSVDRSWLEGLWLALEDLCREFCGGMWIGIYSGYDLIRWGHDYGLLTNGEYDRLFNLLQN